MDMFKSTLRLFLSVDIVGSTAFKQGQALKSKGDAANKTSVPAEAWFSPIAQFYREVERAFSKEWSTYVEEIAPKHGWPVGSSPEFWKSAGDELLYVKVLSDHREAYACVHAWMRAINTYRAVFQTHFPSLDLKTSAWIAGFPVHNAEVAFSSAVEKASVLQDDDDPVFTNFQLLHQYYMRGKDAGVTRDFIGPAIDTGFRLSSLATPRKMTVSIDLVLLLISALRMQPPKLGYEDLRFFYEGRVPLKGVLGGTPYPVFWVDMRAENPLEIAEDNLKGNKPLDSDGVKRFCEAFIDAHPDHVFVPYIANNADIYFSKVPDHHRQRLEKLQDYWEKEGEKRKVEEQSAFVKEGGEELTQEGEDKFLSEISLSEINF
ncbi:hypothetical protein F1643_05440 [Azospirillum sp. INR13]|uniref:hypothetical protein n=1 Tax=Azospirillum sp. INR13 TaxID=2596919 RepID=UPI0018921298|nr:hypothetical protein [Azospirillum sp. INR13]MBF5094005.1 hypothetical protein [Azospirillum sp. INR13]